MKAYHDGFKPYDFFGVAKCGSLRAIEANANLMIQMKENVEAP